MTRIAPQHSTEGEDAAAPHRITMTNGGRTTIGIGLRGGVQGTAIGRIRTGAEIAPALQRPAQHRPLLQKTPLVRFWRRGGRPHAGLIGLSSTTEAGRSRWAEKGNTYAVLPAPQRIAITAELLVTTLSRIWRPIFTLAMSAASVKETESSNAMHELA